MLQIADKNSQLLILEIMLHSHSNSEATLQQASYLVIETDKSDAIK